MEIQDPTGKRCQSVILPLNERKMRACGRPAVAFVNGKWRCQTCRKKVRVQPVPKAID